MSNFEINLSLLRTLSSKLGKVDRQAKLEYLIRFAFIGNQAAPPGRDEDDDDLDWIMCEQPECHKWYHKDCVAEKLNSGKRIARGRKWFCCI